MSGLSLLSPSCDHLNTYTDKVCIQLILCPTDNTASRTSDVHFCDQVGIYETVISLLGAVTPTSGPASDALLARRGDAKIRRGDALIRRGVALIRPGE